MVIVDEFTGRVLVGRRYNEGMHQAIEAKEHVEIKAENQTLATITLQNYFRLYDKLSGMTGTAQTEAAELHEIYKLGVVPIPTNKAMIRTDQSDLIYKTEEAKYIAVVDDVSERYEKGQPVLIGTTSVERSEYLSRQFQKRRIPHNVLNAKYHEQEAGIIAEAGRRSAITVATNMAGRGTDIVLGGNVDFLTDLRLRARGLDPVETADEYDAAWHEELPLVKEEAAAEAKEVIEAGGLYVLGTERHESRRIDNQLRGRSGRQGDPGESRFYLSLGDELMRRFNGAALESLLTRLNLPDDVPIEAKMVTRAIKSAQTQVEQQNFEVRKNVLKYDEVMNQQRKVIYDERRRILEGENLQQQAHDMLVDVITAYVDGATARGLRRGLGSGEALGGPEDAVSGRHRPPQPDRLRRGRRARRTDPRGTARRADRGRRERLRAAGSRTRRARRRGCDASAGTQRAAQRHRPQVARASLRDGLPQRGHRPARDGAARPAGRVPARGLRHVHRHAGRPQGRVRRLPVQRRSRGGSGAAGRPGRRAGRPGRVRRRRCANAQQQTGAAREPAPALRAKGIDNEAPALTYSGPAEDGSAQVQGNGGNPPAGASGGSRRERREAARRQGRHAKTKRR